MTANRLPNHVTPTNKVFPIVSVACAITSIWDKGVHVRHIMQEFGEKKSDFLQFYSKDDDCSKGLCFAMEKTLFCWVILFKRYKKAPTFWPGIDECWVLSPFVHVVNQVLHRASHCSQVVFDNPYWDWIYMRLKYNGAKHSFFAPFFMTAFSAGIFPPLKFQEPTKIRNVNIG